MITVSQYDGRWSDWYDQLQRELAKALSAWSPDISHFGSTSIRGLSAKPIIDVLVGVASEQVYDSDLVRELDRLSFYPVHIRANLRRQIFARRVPPVDANLHVVPREGMIWKNCLLFRDWLREHPDTATEYQRLKVSLGGTLRVNPHAYGAAKNPFIRNVLATAIADRKERDPTSDLGDAGIHSFAYDGGSGGNGGSASGGGYYNSYPCTPGAGLGSRDNPWGAGDGSYVWDPTTDSWGPAPGYDSVLLYQEQDGKWYVRGVFYCC
jgi:GrpB-like predicted nucleotidyltransferase (UPF0157 family)